MTDGFTNLLSHQSGILVDEFLLKICLYKQVYILSTYRTEVVP